MKTTLAGLQIQITTLEANLLDTVNVLKALKNKVEEMDGEIDVMLETMFSGGPTELDQ